MNLFPKNPTKRLQSGEKILALDRPILVGVLNVTPDSFSDGGQFYEPTHALEHARQMIRDGADWLDVGGESSGPGSEDVSLEEELERVISVIQAVRQESDVWISVDTYKAEVARKAVEAGADVVNDVTALRRDEQMLEFLLEQQVPVIIMYSKNADARTTVQNLDYKDVIKTVREFFKERLVWMQTRGIRAENIILDPGMGFFISGVARYSFEILRRLPEMAEWGYPLMVGASRKSFLARVSPGKNLAIHEREVPSAIATGIAAWNGATLLRVHDVPQTRLVLDTVEAIQSS